MKRFGLPRSARLTDPLGRDFRSVATSVGIRQAARTALWVAPAPWVTLDSLWGMLESYWGCLERPGGELEKIGENYQLSKHLNFFGGGGGG